MLNLCKYFSWLLLTTNAVLSFVPTSNSFGVPLTSATQLSSPESFSRNVVGAAFTRNSDDITTLKATATDNMDDAIDMQDVMDTLDKALNAKADNASKLLTMINDMRQNKSQEELSIFLGKILEKVDDSKPFWTRIRVMSKLSKRARLASLKRVLDMSTPTATDDDDEDAATSRRIRALVVALRSLVKTNDDGTKQASSIFSIEKAARKDAKQMVSAEDMESRVPEGLETPTYEVIVKRPSFEIREYQPFSVCKVPMSKPRPDATATDQKVSQPQLSGASSFGALAGYLFGKNKEEKAMKMTTPVLTTGEGEDKSMAFVLPSDYWQEDSLKNAPTPLDNSLVELKREDVKQVAVVMFGGFASSKDVESKKEKLLKSLENDKDWMVSPESEKITLAQYNDPFTPPWRRRNEVSISVVPRS
ncbi:hypothetical protein CTEN210_17049 [Chaetoceros tenuissimus]|uniref:SOUL heme-binding protein n=1 Tax=Chaetoceros tenuissimus TaxID=426638 RepID=A0AAD3HF04_9STRA|nr:hypothetical protein CTEN210_17049 [Chaetoceros tenuissimus]